MMVAVTQLPGMDSATDELYAGQPADFVARRDELAKRARASGNRVLASEIRALRRPTLGAWYLNVASRAGLTSLHELLGLGRDLRETQASGNFAALRELALRRGPLVTRVLRDLTAHLAQLGVTATAAGLEEVRTTLGAALADPAVDHEVRSGRLDRPHTYGGFGEVDMTSPQTAAAAVASGEEVLAPPPENAAAGAGREEKEQASARSDLRAAEREVKELTARMEAADAGVLAARARLESVAVELAEAQSAVAAAEDEVAGMAAKKKVLNARIEQARSYLRP